jgi:hypothetical protein
LAAALAGGCNDSTVAVGNDNPLGTVGGLIYDASNQMPLVGANVKVISGGLTFAVQTGMDGAFSIPKVPAGPFIFSANQTGYTTATFGSNLYGAAGNFPVKNPVQTIGPIGLIKADGAFNVRLVDETGAPVPMVKVTAHTQNSNYVDFSNGNPFGVGETSFAATSGADGLVQLTGLPDFALLGTFGNISDTLTVDVPPVKVSGTESYSFLGVSVSFRLSNLNGGGATPQAPTITLAGPHTSLLVLGSNIPFLRGAGNFVQSLTVPPNGPLTVEFNQAINPNTVRVVFYNEDGITQAQAQPMATVTTNLLSMTPNQALVAGARYNVLIHVDASLTPTVNDPFLSTEYNVLAPFFVQQASGVTPTVNMNSISKAANGGLITVTFTLNEPIGLGQQSSGGIDCVAFYEGVNLDNGDPAPYVGEWAATLPLQCIAQSNPAPGMNITVLRPLEQTGPAPVTGFASKFAIDINNMPAVGANSAACKPTDPPGSCGGPSSGNKIHLVFSHLPASQTIRRTNGQPVTDDATKLVIPIP